MKHLTWVLLLGVVVGGAAHALWFQLRRPPVSPSPLQWLQHDLQLTEEQFARIKALHERSSPQFEALAAQAGRLRLELAAFERRRREEGQIDFLAFAHFIEAQRAFDRRCAESTHRLIAAAAGEMTAPQRDRYLRHLDPSPAALAPGLN